MHCHDAPRPRANWSVSAPAPDWRRGQPFPAVTAGAEHFDRQSLSVTGGNRADVTTGRRADVTAGRRAGIAAGRPAGATAGRGVDATARGRAGAAATASRAGLRSRKQRKHRLPRAFTDNGWRPASYLRTNGASPIAVRGAIAE